MGVAKTIAKVVEKHYWPKMRQDVAHYIQKCRDCATHKIDRKRPNGQITPQPQATYPWEIVCTDFMGLFPNSTKGNKLILASLLEYFRCVLQQQIVFVQLWRMKYSCYLEFLGLLCDNGPQYRSSRFRALRDEYGVKIRYNAYYHPQVNPSERYNQTIKTMISLYVSDNHRK